MSVLRYLVTGTAGFIGFHTAKALLSRGNEVVGVDNLNAYYDPALKQARLDRLVAMPGFTDVRADIADSAKMKELFAQVRPDRVINLAAQAGVRYSVENPHAYAEANLIGFLNILEGCRHNNVEHLVYASTSSVYGGNEAMPFEESDGVGHPVSFYAATKRANELMAHSYSHLYAMPTTGLRFFTVYGPWGRPDMALFKFTKAIIEEQPIDVYNNGEMIRDFTYVDDIVEGIVRVSDKPAERDPNWNAAERTPAPNSSGIAPFRIFNIGNGRPVGLMDFIRAIEEKLQKPAKLNMMPMQAGDVAGTSADTSSLNDAVSYRPDTPLVEGVANFIDWYRAYYGK